MFLTKEQKQKAFKQFMKEQEAIRRKYNIKIEDFKIERL